MTAPELPLAPREARADAYDRASETSADRRQEVLDLLMAHPEGMTADELARDLKRDPYVVRPRLTELKKSGRIYPVGRRAGLRSDIRITVWKPAA